MAKTDDVFVRSKIELLYNYSVAFFLLGLVFYIHILYVHLWYHAAATGIAMVSLITIPFILKYAQSVKLAAWVYIIQQIIVSNLSILIEHGKSDMTGGFWVTL